MVTSVQAPPAMRSERLLIGGEWRDASSGARWERVAAGTDVVSASVADATEADAVAAIEAARRAFDTGPWPRTTPRERARVLIDTAQLLRDRREEVAAVEAAQVGKPYKYALGDVDGAADLLEYYAGVARTVSGRTVPEVAADTFGLTIKEPIGVCAMIIAWNFPLLLLCQKIAPALAAGCTVIAKPAPATPSSAIMIAEMLVEAGLPDGVMNVLTEADPGRTVGQVLTASPLVDKVSFTGSTATAEHVIKSAAPTMKRVSIEAGGKSPHIVHGDADLDAASAAVANAIFFNSGQVCIAGSRLIVDERVADEVIERVKTAAEQLVVGDPFDPTTDMGPLVNARQADALRERLNGVDPQAIVTGSTTIDELGFATPTVLTGLDADHPLVAEELFGPVLTVLTYSDIDQAIRLANQTPYGLAAGVWTNDLNVAMRVAREVRAGTVWVNTYLSTFAELPHGGFGMSGIGRELGPEGIEAYLESKTVQIHTVASVSG